MLNHARQFLHRVMPGGIGEGAYLNIHWMSLTTAGKKFWDGRACTSVDDAVSVIDWANRHGDKDIYVCMSLQAKCEKKTSRKGGEYKRALRLADDAVMLRSLFVDVDVKDGAYPTTQAAGQALKEFLAASKLPPPSAVVASGSGGFHVHWALDKALPRDKWLLLATALANAVRQHGLLADTQCTVDAARILRVPDTFNRKGDVPRPVTLMSLGGEVSAVEMVKALAPYKGATALHAAPLQVPLPLGPGIGLDANEDLGANLPDSRPAVEIRVEDLTPQCGFITRALGTGGKDNSQPLWFLTAAVASFLEDGREALHAMSKEHPGYSSAETDELYDRVVATKEKRNLGWPTCQKIALAGCKDCATCPLFVQNKSPLNFATAVTKAATADKTLPDRFVRNADGIISLRTITDDGTPLLVPVSHYPMLHGSLSNNPWTFHLLTRNERGKRVLVDVPTEVIFAKDGFSKYMGSRGFFLTDTEYKLTKEFFVAWLKKLQQSKDSVISSVPFGWSIVDGAIEGFAYGGRVWMKDGDRPAANPSPQLQFQYSPRGSIDVWRKVAKVIYGQKRPGLDALLAVAFAGPLVHFTGFGGLLFNAYSPESGIGKSTTMKTSLAVWGHPTLAMKGLSDTVNAVLGTMGQTQHMPMYWDEIKGRDQTAKFCSIVFELTRGAEKARMKSDTTLREQGTWQTLMASASNASVIDGMSKAAGSTTAGLHRLFEFRIPGVPQAHDPSIQVLLGQLENNYGNAGLIYAKFLGANWKRIQEEVTDLQNALTSEVSAKSEERFWIGTMAVLLKGAEYANELGLTDIELGPLRALLLDVLMGMRKEIDKTPSDLTNDLGVSTVLAELLNSSRARHTLVTNRIWVSKGRAPKGAIQIQCDVTKLAEIGLQIGVEDRIIRISSTFLTRWMAEREYSKHTFISELEQQFGMRWVVGRLGSGTEVSFTQERLIELDCNHPKLSPLLED